MNSDTLGRERQREIESESVGVCLLETDHSAFTHARTAGSGRQGQQAEQQGRATHRHAGGCGPGGSEAGAPGMTCTPVGGSRVTRVGAERQSDQLSAGPPGGGGRLPRAPPLLHRRAALTL